MDNRKNIKVEPHVKDELVHLKNQLNMRSESQAIDYLLRVYKAKRKNLTLTEHETAVREVKEAHDQLSL
ncbi:hypothetical protein [Paenibacillus alvei]|uniref:hypothetical protein n=1 Tax=Paenibacillus alvei TaxID=44250 RepID=UPI0022822FF4|nr:hypothetical protein [Paenibacillus alvei]